MGMSQWKGEQFENVSNELLASSKRIQESLGI